jgi:hypothetical protein
MAQFKMIAIRVSALVLWLMTIGLSIADIYFTRELFFALYARASTEGRTAAAGGNILVVLAAIAALGFIVVSTEYHRKHFLKHESWDALAWSLVVLLAIPFIATYIV